MLVVHFGGHKQRTKQPLKSETRNGENGLGKTTSLLFTVMLRATPHKEAIGKECKKSGKNAVDLRQQTKDLLAKLGR